MERCIIMEKEKKMACDIEELSISVVNKIREQYETALGQLNEVVLKVERRVRLGDADKLISQLNADGIVVLEGSLWRSASERPGAGLESPSAKSSTVTPPPQCLASSGEWIWGVAILAAVILAQLLAYKWPGVGRFVRRSIERLRGEGVRRRSQTAVDRALAAATNALVDGSAGVQSVGRYQEISPRAVAFDAKPATSVNASVANSSNNSFNPFVCPTITPVARRGARSASTPLNRPMAPFATKPSFDAEDSESNETKRSSKDAAPTSFYDGGPDEENAIERMAPPSFLDRAQADDMKKPKQSVKTSEFDLLEI